MFDINEIQGKILLKTLEENTTRIVEELKTGKNIYVENSRTSEKFKISFTNVNGSSYKAILDFEDDREQKEYKLLTNGNLSIIVFSCTMIMYIKENILHIIAPDELRFYE